MPGDNMRKIAIVTGCAKGIGKQIALTLASNNYDIIGTYNTSLKLIEELKQQVEAKGVSFIYFKLDLLEDSSIVSFCNEINKKYKNIDILINNAALSLDNDFISKTSLEFSNVLKVNLVGPFILTQKLYKKLNNGIIINISSTDGINTYNEFNIDYSASKAGLINLTKSLSLILENTKVYAICPNFVNTESVRDMNIDYLNSELIRINQKKLIEPVEVANKVLDLTLNDYESGSIVVMEDSCE